MNARFAQAWFCAWLVGLVFAPGLGPHGSLKADPCGMVPPVYTVPPVDINDQDVAIKRIGRQRTYVFYHNQVEAFVIHPAFEGKVDNFGMLIPFPSPPALRKVSDDLFEHLAAAIDPPEVVWDLRPPPPGAFGGFGGGGFGGGMGGMGGFGGGLGFQRDTVRVLREEAVGMYEVAVLEAGSAAALKKWMDDHGYRYPAGMDNACEDYVNDGWCFVAVKTKVAQKQGVDPKPGMREVNPKLPKGSVFDGAVQAMGFRFTTPKLVVPMRLSAFNKGDLHNVVYVLADAPVAIQHMSQDYVVRQVPGEQLYRNLTSPLPLRVLGGRYAGGQIVDGRFRGGRITNFTNAQIKALKTQRDPAPRNGLARELFASDLLSASQRELSLPHEEQEKELLQISESLQLRGPALDTMLRNALAKQRAKALGAGLAGLKHMTLTVIDGEFPRDVLSKQNITFYRFAMPARRNQQKFYDAKSDGPPPARHGVLIGALDSTAPGDLSQSPPTALAGHVQPASRWPLYGLCAAAGCLALGAVFVLRRPR